MDDHEEQAKKSIENLLQVQAQLKETGENARNLGDELKRAKEEAASHQEECSRALAMAEAGAITLIEERNVAQVCILPKFL